MKGWLGFEIDSNNNGKIQVKLHTSENSKIGTQHFVKAVILHVTALVNLHVRNIVVNTQVNMLHNHTVQ